MDDRKLKAMVWIGILILMTFVMACTKATASLKLDKSKYAPGEQINVQYTALEMFEDNAWIGIIPSDVPHGNESENDKHDLTYQYLKKSTAGTMTFTAPLKTGKYDFRMHDTDDDGKEVASVSFSVEGTIGPSELKLDKKTYKPGENIVVTFTAPAAFPDKSWVGIIPSNIAHGSESVNDQHDLAYQYLKKRTTGTLTFTAPADPGKYDIRMNSTDSDGVETASVSFTVK